MNNYENIPPAQFSICNENIFWPGHASIYLENERPWKDSFSSPKPLGVICNEPVAPGRSGKYKIFRWLKIRNWTRRANERHDLLRIRFYFLSCQTAETCLIYVDRNNPVLFLCNSSEEGIKGKGWDVSTMTTSLDKESLPSLCAKPCLCIDHRILGNWKEEY